MEMEMEMEIEVQRYETASTRLRQQPAIKIHYSPLPSLSSSPVSLVESRVSPTTGEKLSSLPSSLSLDWTSGIGVSRRMSG